LVVAHFLGGCQRLSKVVLGAISLLRLPYARFVTS